MENFHKELLETLESTCEEKSYLEKNDSLGVFDDGARVTGEEVLRSGAIRAGCAVFFCASCATWAKLGVVREPASQHGAV